MIDRDEESDYKEFFLKDLGPSYPLPADIFIFLRDNFVCYKHKGDMIEESQFKRFCEKKLDYLYIQKKDFEIFEAWRKQREDSGVAIKTQEGKKNLISKLGKESSMLVDQFYEMKDRPKISFPYKRLHPSPCKE